LSGYEELSLASLVARGQHVLLYSYDPTLRVPDGVELVDANEILPGDRIYEFTSPEGERTPALHSDLFRYEVLRRFGGWYFDLDVVLLRDRPPSMDVYIAYEDESVINGAVMRFPPGSEIMIAASRAARDRLDTREWGAIGPKLITKLAKELGLAKFARPWPRAFPIRPLEARLLFLPKHHDELAERVATADFVHLWHDVWRRVRIPKNYGPPEGSFLDSLFRRFDIRVARGARLSPDAITSWFHEFEFLEGARRRYDSSERMADLEQAWQQRDEMLASSSWRVTAPLRACINAFRHAFAGRARGAVREPESAANDFPWPDTDRRAGTN
jgi:hypothetical protein